MELAALIVTLLLGVPALYFQWRAHARAGREFRRNDAASVQVRKPEAQTPSPSPRARPRRQPRRDQAEGLGEPPEAGGFAWLTAWWGVMVPAIQATYLDTEYKMEIFSGSVSEYAGAMRAGLVLTGLLSIGLLISAWIFRQDDLLFYGRTQRGIIWFQTLGGLSGLAVCVLFVIVKNNYVF